MSSFLETRLLPASYPDRLLPVQEQVPFWLKDARLERRERAAARVRPGKEERPCRGSK